MLNKVTWYEQYSTNRLLRQTLYDSPDLKLFILVGWDRSSFVCCLVHRGSTDDLLLQISSGVVWQTRDLHLSRNTLYLLSPRLCFFIVLKRDLFVRVKGLSLSCEPNNQLNVLYHFRN